MLTPIFDYYIIKLFYFVQFKCVFNSKFQNIKLSAPKHEII